MPDERGAKAASSVLQGQMLVNTVGGGKSGERNRRSLFADTTSVLPEMKAERKSTPRNGSFAMVLVTSGMIEKGEICGGMIKSTVDTFCAKGKCTTTSHARKHALFGVNRVFLASFSASAPNTTRKVIEPEKIHLEVVNPRDPHVLAIIKGGTQDLKGITSLEEAG